MIEALQFDITKNYERISRYQLITDYFKIGIHLIFMGFVQISVKDSQSVFHRSSKFKYIVT